MALVLAGCSSHRAKLPPGDLSTITVSNTVQVANVMRFGVNLGTWTNWGAEQLYSNVIMNPGFEGIIDRAILSVRNPVPGKFYDEGFWLAREDGFWEQARFDVLSGRNAGATGKIIRSRKKDTYGLPSFSTDSGILELDSYDVVSVTRTVDSGMPSQWWFTDRPGVRFSSDNRQKRPGSKGLQCLRIGASGEGAEFASYLDAIGERAGKLLPLVGKWRLSFWSRLDKGAARMRVMVRREGTRAMMEQDIALSSDWRRTEIVFDARDPGPPWIASLRFYITGAPNGEVLLDDVDLRRVSDSGEFRGEVVSVLKELRPAYLRDWQGQLGDTLENRIGPVEARRVTRYRPGDLSETGFNYGLPEFLELAKQVGASPWIVVPPPFTQAECGELGRYLRDGKDYQSFPEIVVEFGNENWNPVFRFAGIPEPAPHGEAADRCFTAIRANAGRLPLLAAVNGQHDNPDRAAAFARASHSANLFAVAPYFFPKLDAGTDPARARAMLFAGDGGRLAKIAAEVRKSGMEPAVYEVNLHTDDGSATQGDRDWATSGAVSAPALAKTMLDALALGVRRQCVYTLAGFDNRAKDGKSYVKLWGIVRDLTAANHFRPTGLALEMLNRVLRGSMVRTDTDDQRVSLWAFRDGQNWSAILVSSADHAREALIRFPDGAKMPKTLWTLQADSPAATNEDGTHVTIQKGSVRFNDKGATVAVPPYGLLALMDEEGEPNQGRQ